MMIPWCFAYDKVNYARYVSPYFAQMINLAETKPEVQRVLCCCKNFYQHQLRAEFNKEEG